MRRLGGGAGSSGGDEGSDNEGSLRADPSIRRAAVVSSISSASSTSTSTRPGDRRKGAATGEVDGRRGKLCLAIGDPAVGRAIRALGDVLVGSSLDINAFCNREDVPATSPTGTRRRLPLPGAFAGLSPTSSTNRFIASGTGDCTATLEDRGAGDCRTCLGLAVFRRAAGVDDGWSGLVALYEPNGCSIPLILRLKLSSSTFVRLNS